MKVRSTLLVLVMAGTCFTLLTGCDPLTRERYEMITLNVDQQFDVEKMIGPPDYKLPGQWHYERVDKHLNVKIEFDENGVVTRKEWIDALAETWEDTQQPGDEPTYETTEIRTSEQ